MKCFNLSVIATFCLATLSAADCSAGDPVIVASGKGANTPSQPQVAVGSEGSVHLVYGTGDAVQYCQSLDGGTTFGKAMQAFRVPNMSLGMRRGPRVVKTKDAIVISPRLVVRSAKAATETLLPGDRWTMAKHGKVQCE